MTTRVDSPGSISREPGSFKDPDGCVLYIGGAVYRSLSGDAAERMQRLCDQGHLQNLVDAGLVVPTRPVAAKDIGLKADDVGPIVLQHDRIEVITYPYEWPFALLRDAALVTLDIIERCLAFGCILKDATPFNIALFRGRPVLIDVPSIDAYEEGTPWEGYAQFCREFLFPLLLAAHKGVATSDLLRGNLNGISLELANGLFSFGDLLKAGVAKHVKLQALFQRLFRKSDFSAQDSFADSRFGKGQILANVKNLRAILNGLTTHARDSAWIEYADTHSYSEAEQAAKQAFVRSMLEAHAPRRVVDIGCNTGAYSRIASGMTDVVVSIDSDPVCVDRLYRAGRADGVENVFPVVADLLNPSPGMGWMMRERASLFDRVHGDSFLALALVHHVAIQGNVPIDQFVEALSDLADGGVVEWVDKADPMVQRLLKNRRDVFGGYAWDRFKQAIEQRFRIEDVADIGDGRRRLCRVRRRQAPSA